MRDPYSVLYGINLFPSYWQFYNVYSRYVRTCMPSPMTGQIPPNRFTPGDMWWSLRGVCQPWPKTYLSMCATQVFGHGHSQHSETHPKSSVKWPSLIRTDVKSMLLWLVNYLKWYQWFLLFKYRVSKIY